MSAPPAFQFYADDFLAGTYDMTQAEVGSYIRLLCEQWNRGSIRLEPEFIQRKAGGPVSEFVLSKFQVGEDGLGRNKRLEEVRQKQSSFIESQRLKGLKSAEKRFNPGSTPVQPRLDSGCRPVEPEGNSPSPSPSPVQREREATVTNPGGRPKNVEEVIEKGKFIGISENDCRAWFSDCEECGWRRGDGTAFENWPRQLILHRDRMRSNHRPSGHNASASVFELKEIVKVKEERAAQLRAKNCSEVAMGDTWNDPAKRAEYFAIKKEVKELKRRIEAHV